MHTLLAALISIALLFSLILSLSSLASLTSLAIILPRLMCANDECFVHRISGVSFTFRAQCDAHTYTKFKNLNGFSIGFVCSHSAHNVTLARIQNLNGFSIGFFCSHSAHNVTLTRIQNLNGFSIGFFCSHSAHNVTLARIHRLPTSVGLAQARPNNHRLYYILASLYVSLG